MSHREARTELLARTIRDGSLNWQTGLETIAGDRAVAANDARLLNEAVNSLVHAGLLVATGNRVWEATAKGRTKGVPKPRRLPKKEPAASSVTVVAAPDPLARVGPRPKADRTRELAARLATAQATIAAAGEIPDVEASESLRLVQAKSDDWRLAVPALFPRTFTIDFAPYQAEFFEWAWSLTPDETPNPWISCWGRDGGKALDLETPLPTPTGWTTMGEVQPGDQLLNEKGEPVRVLRVSPVMTKPTWRVGFKGGYSIDASEDHLWTVLDRSARRQMNRYHHEVLEDWPTWKGKGKAPAVCELCGRICAGSGPSGEKWCGMHHARWRKYGDPHANGKRVRKRTTAPFVPLKDYPQAKARTITTEAMAAGDLQSGNRQAYKEWQYAIPTCLPFDLPDVTLPVEPWLLGLWLGDGTRGCGTITVGYEDLDSVLAIIKSLGHELISIRRYEHAAYVTIKGLARSLRVAGVIKRKHVPDAYLRASERQRRALLRGLCDSDGSRRRNSVDFVNTNESLSLAVHELAVSLGYRASLTEKRTSLNGKDCGPAWRVRFPAPPAEVFAIPRKSTADSPVNSVSPRMHYITSMEFLGDRQVKCAAVDSPNHLYLAGRNAVPTHNSSCLEAILILLGARGVRDYAWLVASTQDAADEHVDGIEALLTSSEVATVFPLMATRDKGKYGPKEWRRNRLVTEAGFVVDAIGLDTAARGRRFEERRANIMAFDDIDDTHDTPKTIEKRIATLTRKIIPAGSQDCIVMGVQNMIHGRSIFARLARVPGAPEADFLATRRVSGPIKLVDNMEYQRRPDGDGYEITGGAATWPARGLAGAQRSLDKFGLTSFLIECQHEEGSLGGGIFEHLDFGIGAGTTISEAAMPELKHICCWVDPAVSATDRSDSMGIVIAGIGADRRYYMLWSWERVTTPLDALTMAITSAVEYGAKVLGVETDQGGDTWQVVYRSALRSLTEDPDSKLNQLLAENPDRHIPRYEYRKAGSTGQSKVERASRMLVDYELGKVKHVDGLNFNCRPLESGLKRFPVHKPFDCVDAAYWCWRWLADHGGESGARRMTTKRAQGSLPEVRPHVV